jgi:hypothetical protein
MPSNIPEAREMIKDVLASALPEWQRQRLERALSLMTRDPAVRKARSKMPPLTEGHKDRIRAWAKQCPDMSCSEIAIAVCLPASAGGRVSEVLNGLR